jgi:peptidyl-prolyl cis-trans isomerase B (cyclophilin B)
VLKPLGEILFGRVCPAGVVTSTNEKCRYAKRAGDEPVFAVVADAADSLLEGHLAFRDRQVLRPAKKDKIVKIAVQRGAIRYAAEKKGDKWTLTSPVGEDADESAVGRYLDRMNDLTAEKVAAEDAKGNEKALAGYGLDKPSGWFEIAEETSADPKVQKVLIGKPSASGGLYAMVPGGDLVYELSRYAADDTGGEFVRRSLMAFDKTKAKSVTVASRHGEMRLVKTGLGWSVEKPGPAAPADKDKVEALLSALAALGAERVVEYAPAGLASFGLEKPAVSVTVETDDGRKQSVLIGDGLSGGTFRYAKVPDRASVFALDKAAADKLEAPPADFRSKAPPAPKPAQANEPPKAAGEEKPAAATIDAKALPRVTIRTERGNIVLDLFEDQAPNTVANFIGLAEKGFYNGLTFHRVIHQPDEFMIQGGCPRGDGSGDAGYKFADECKGNPHKVVRGMLCMANSGPDTNGSQFFIVTAKACPWLDGKHTVFGTVVEGQDVVDKIQQGDKMTAVEVNRKRREKYEVRKL